ncbi:WD40 repeat domain-containing protein [Leptolyngbya sp. BC1307]|uniref:WD40 repeat domain-containing protein n=1 Tax=Leptolyngbya sp. BC1307 TaxID=2029589 RepID=UPI001F0A7989|nr:WD40 repeat domain-containing protein [Leptolyngbya sp. BC1307]
MPGLIKSPLLSLSWQGQLQDYVTAMNWSPDGKWLALASGSGEVMLLHIPSKQTIAIEPSAAASIDCLGFSYDGQFLAAGGQNGQVKVWRLAGDSTPDSTPDSTLPTLVKVLEHSRTWVEHLAWSPTRNELAFGLGRYVQVWDIARDEMVTTLPFETSSVLDIAWHPDGEQLAVSGHLAVKIWSRSNWDNDPRVQELVAAGLAIAISPDGQYLAAGNLDNTLMVWGWESPYPWRMTGFPGKVRHLAWANTTRSAAPIIAASSGAGLIIWRKLPTDDAGWASRAFDLHHGKIVALAFQPGTSLLASAAEDGRVILWPKAKNLGQMLDGAAQGFSALAWNPQGRLLAAGGQQGEWLVWAQSGRGKGFLR